MKRMLTRGTVVLMLVAAPLIASAQAPPTPPAGTTTPPSVANAQGPVSLTPAQKSAIVDAVQAKGGAVAPSIAFRPAPGEMGPPSIELYALPDNAISQAPEAKNLKYTMVENQVVLVDPLTMRVVDTLGK
jgi:hypothetical protein